MHAALMLDLDGTLVDSEPRHIRAHQRFLQTVGIQVSRDDLVGNIGKGDHTFYQELARRSGVPGDSAEWVRSKTDVLIAIYAEEGLPTRTGVTELLDHCRREGVCCCVVTSSERRLARAALEASDLADRLPIRVCAEDTVQHKPHPEPYLLAASRLGVPPARCVVIEDSVSGVTAAVAAGMTTIGFAGLVPADALRAAGAVQTLDTMGDLVPLSALGQRAPLRRSAAR